jgi:DNA (cytosine-5)-methyltransferase 1
MVDSGFRHLDHGGRMSDYRLLDLFCGAGGAGMGYHRAGFTVIGVDLNPQPHYPFEFHQADALTFPLDGYDAIHASPPCQHYSKMSLCKPGLADTYPDLVEPTRQRLAAAGVPYIIENVEGAPLIEPTRICGSGLGMRLQRHRLFETNWAMWGVPCAHGQNPWNPAYKHATGRKRHLRVDAMIAGTATAVGARMATGNRSDFEPFTKHGLTLV